MLVIHFYSLPKNSMYLTLVILREIKHVNMIIRMINSDCALGLSEMKPFYALWIIFIIQHACNHCNRHFTLLQIVLHVPFLCAPSVFHANL